MSKLELCPYDVSKDLKEIGFDWECSYNYYEGKLYHVLNNYIKQLHTSYIINNCGNNWELVEKGELDTLYKMSKSTKSWMDIPIPELELASKWFRNVHDIIIEPAYGRLNKCWTCNILWDNTFENLGDYSEEWTYEQSLLEGLKEAIKIIKTK